MSDEDVMAQLEEVLEDFLSPTASAPYQFCDRYPADSAAFRIVDRSLEESVLTFGQLARRSRRIATVLHEAGVGPGDRVATLMGKSADLPAVILATWRLGAVYLPLFTAFAHGAVSDRLVRAEAKAIVADEAQISKIPEGAWTVFVAGTPTAAGPQSLADLVEASPEWTEEAPTGPEVPLVHIFTSGTTGKPKTVVHPKLHAAGWCSYLKFGIGADQDAVFWCAADPGWAYGLYTGILAPLALGRTSLLTLGTFNPGTTWEILERYQVTHFAAAPTALRAMKADGGERPLPALAHVSCAGEPLTPDVLAWTTGLAFPAHDHFGQTELGMVAGFPHHASLAVPVEPHAMGRAFPGWSTAVLSLDADEPADSGAVGRFAVDVPNSPFFTFTGYGTGRDEDGSRFVGGGKYFVTGDLAENDESGLLRFSSRDDDVILMAGYRIGPYDVESSLLAHPAVQEAVVVAAPDELRGEIIHAFVVVAPGVEGTPELVSELQEWVKADYAAHAFPRRIDFIDSLPKTESGKVRRSELRRRLQERQ
ncbi:AMP-binding protein [Sinomonas sp. P47F7]|uniref:AMP-binding protein n=1 Tax=Sinomonas sp. P47F7 TaxID=3410987 RepID=UPI003BF49F32